MRKASLNAILLVLDNSKNFKNWYWYISKAFCKNFPKITVKLDGHSKTTERQNAIDSFQNNPNIKLFVGNIKAAGECITLTAASNVAFIELPWTPGEIDQCADRCHRIGQYKNVTIYYLLAINTVDEKIANLLDSKR